MDKEKVWKYYGEVAEKLGEDRDKYGEIKKDENGKNVQAGFSLKFFYDNENLDSRATLLKAFLGDENAISAEQWDVPFLSEDKISQWLSTDKKPYQNQIEAIRYAVSKPLTLIQGPPGTGKTEMILNLLSVIHGKYPDKTVAVVSANNEAINNITEKIEEDAAFSNIKEAYTQWGSNKILYQWQNDHEDYKEYFYQKERDKGDPICRFDPQLLTKIPLFSCTIHSLRKIFVSGELFRKGIFESNEQFDYVIVDECSQVSTLLGLVAMGSARKHLVLIGDNEQLAPVIDEKKLGEIEKRYSEQDVPKDCRVTENNTFLKVCEKIFEGKAQSVMLNEHYRCHRAIIGFCNEYVYDGKLIVQTKGDGHFPIRVLWYEGEYSEYLYQKNKQGDKDKKSLRNMRQIEIFLREEWPLLRGCLEDDPNTSICVISPYRGQLEVLEKLLRSEIKHEKNRELKALIKGDLGLESEKEEPEEKIPCLTIHKSQGKGFDIVCFLSVCDYDSPAHEPWAQGRRMINVVVSRAKKEFHLITCNQWLPEEFQEKEIGYLLRHPEKKADYYLLQLIDYTYKNMKNRNLQDSDFGFHRSSITSLFDRVPLYRKNEPKTSFIQKKRMQTSSAPEKCMRQFLEKNFSGEYKIYREVLLGEIYPPDECNDDELKEYIKNGSRIDFLICKDKNALLAIEVDGEQHRTGKEEKERRDELKNRCFDLMEKQMAFLRINTDGSGRWEGTYDKDGIKILTKESEVKKMSEYLNEAEKMSEHKEFTNENGNAFMVSEADKDDLLKYYKYFLENVCLKGLKSYYKKYKELPALSYKDQDTIDDIAYNDKATNELYFCKYGIAYAFEYAILYEIMLKSYEGKQFGVYSLGCGGYIDAWSLAYARAKLKVQGLCNGFKLYYEGLDACQWERMVFGEKNEKMTEIKISDSDTEWVIPDFKVRELQKNGIAKFKPGNLESKKMLYNVLMFPKILNELDDVTLNTFIERLNEFEYERPVYYICASHSCYQIEKGTKAVQKIVEMFIDKGFEPIDDIADSFLKEIIGNNWIENKEGMYKYYNIDDKKIGSINPDFSCKEIEDYLLELNDETGGVYKCNQMTNARYIAFQIIKLEKKA